MTSSQVGTYSRLRVEASIAATSAIGIYTDVDWDLYFEETSGSNNLAFNNAGVTASVSMTGQGTVWSGSFNFDWRPGGLQAVHVASGTERIYHSADGTPPASFKVTGNNGATGSSGGGSGGSVVKSLPLSTLKVLPGTPTGVAAAYVSDTQVNLTWAQTSATNGQPDTNTIQKSVNGGAWTDVATVAATTAASVAVATNQQNEFRVLATNAAGSTAYSASSAAVYTTPGAPTNAVAVKSGSDIVVTFDENVDYAAYNHEVWHGTVAGAVITWDGAALTALAAGVLTYTHVAPSAVLVHVYRVRAKSGTLYSSYAESNSVQLLTAPAKPTIPATAAFADKASIFRFSWVHNPVDSSAQTKYQYRYSTNGGSTWVTTSAKTASTNQYYDFAANTWAANAAITFEVRTKGAYDSGADGDASYSPWSDPITVTFKTIPVATITAPANASTLTGSTVSVTVGFAQAEGATFVKTQLELKQGATVLETLESTNQVGIVMATPVQNGVSYTIRSRVQDSNGIWSAWASNAFDVAYTVPVPAVVTLTFLEDTGWVQVDLTIAAPGAGQAAATTVTITRAIDGVVESVVTDYPVASPMTFLDTTPVVNGTNDYSITTKSALGAQSVVTDSLVTTELRRAYLSKGAGYSEVGAFGGNLSVSESLSVASDTVEAAGRTKPIGLYGVETDVSLKVSSFVFEGFGSTPDELRALLLLPGKACYRDSSGRRVFGAAKGSLSYQKVGRATLSFTIDETS